MKEPSTPHQFLARLLKISVLQAALAILFSGISLATTVNGQGILDRKVSLDIRDAALGKALKELEKSGQVKFSYNSRNLPLDQTVTVRAENEALSSVLTRVLKPMNIQFMQVSNMIVLRREAALGEAGHERDLLASILIRLPADQTVTGKVTDETGAELPGVSLVVKGTQIGTTSDSEGNFQLNVPTSVGTQFTLTVSYIGYVTKEVPVTSQSRLSISLEPDNRTLNEVVVVGFGTQRKADVTGSVVRVKTDKTVDLPNYSVLQSLQGRVPGLNISSPDRAGEEPSLSIRGTNSISAGNTPLVVVDGIIYNGRISDFNSNDIATVDVLKDASAAAVYGSRAANGVIIITTKTGSTDTPEFNFNSYVGVQQPSKLIGILDGPKYIQKILDFREAKKLEADPAKIGDYLTVTELENYKNGKTVDWMDHVIQNGVINNYHLDISGRTPKVNYYAAGTYFKQRGIVKNDNFDRATFNLNLTTHVTDWYSVSFKSAFSSQDFSGVAASLSGAYRQSPYGSFSDADGPGGYALQPVGDPLGLHPLVNLLIDNRDIRTSLFGLVSSNLDVPFVPGLKWTMNYSSNLRTNRLNQFTDNRTTPEARVLNGVASKAFNQNHDWTFDNILSYKRVFGQKHSVDLTALASRQRQGLEESLLTGNDFFSQALGYNAIQTAAVQRNSSNFEEQYNIAYMGRINYGFDNRFALTLTARRDGYSGFSKAHKYATFPSAAVAWTVSNERFLKDVRAVSYLKLRASLGKNGNQAVGRYQSLSTIVNDQYLFGGQSITTSSINSLANSNLTWETTVSTNFGADFELFNSLLSGTLDLYNSKTTDLLLRRSLPSTTGYPSTLTNIGSVHNHGVEISLNSVNIKNRNGLSWESGLVFTLNRNRIVHLTGEDADKDGREDDNIANGWFIGESLNSIYGYKTNGVFQLNESDTPSGFSPGDFRIVDTNNDGVINADDRAILGSRLPNYTVSLFNTVKYRNFSLYFMITSVQGGGRKNYYVGDNNSTRNPNAPFTTFTERFNIQDVPYWTSSRPSNEYPRIDYNPSFPHPILESRSFIRLQDVSLSYSFNQDFLKKAGLKNLRLYASGKNIFTLTKWSGYDPENATGLGDFPFLKSYTVGIDFKF